MENFLEQFQKESEKVNENFRKEILSLKTGRATPALVENLIVECYGQKMPLVQLASISSPDPKSIIIQPWDKNTTPEIEKSINQSNLGVTPTTSENTIRLNFPPPTEENRKEIIKILHHKLEEARVSLKKVRENIKETILKAESNNEISEDEKFKSINNLDEEIKKSNEKLKNISSEKEKEILTI
jgi:ribosome recycling factor